jgi:hypothetical protein
VCRTVDGNGIELGIAEALFGGYTPRTHTPLTTTPTTGSAFWHMVGSRRSGTFVIWASAVVGFFFGGEGFYGS